MFSFAKRFVDRFEGGQESTTPDSYFKNTIELNNKGYGLRVLNVKPHSLAHEAGLESWFDFIIRVNQHELPMAYPALSTYSYSINEDGTINYGGHATQEQASMVNYDLLNQEIQTLAQNERGTKELVLDVWSAKGGVIRKVILPLNGDSKDPNGNNQDPVDPAIRSLTPSNLEQLGLTLQSQHVNTASYVWRILNTHQGSPAFQAQLVPYSDYIIGCDSAFPNDPYGKGLLTQGGEALLSKTILRYYNHNFENTHDDAVPITLFVYNHDYDVLRPVTVNLTRAWGNGHNKGILGCDVGYGLLHRIPEVVGKFHQEQLVDDLLYEDNQAVSYQFDQHAPTPQPPLSYLTSQSPETFHQLFTPMAAGVSAPPPPKAGATKKKKATRPNANNDLSEYMNEELQKSKEADQLTKPSTSETSTPPPPPPPGKAPE